MSMPKRYFFTWPLFLLKQNENKPQNFTICSFEFPKSRILFSLLFLISNVEGIKHPKISTISHFERALLRNIFLFGSEEVIYAGLYKKMSSGRES